jgi:hypothetical protein
MAALVAARFLFGACSAGVMPCVAAMAVRWIPKRQRAASTSLVYAAFNLGGVAALAFAPWAAEALAAGGGGGAASAGAAGAAAATASTAGAAGALLVLGAAGVAWAAAGGAWMQALWRRSQQLVLSGDDEAASPPSANATTPSAPPPPPLLPRPADRDSAREIFTLCFAHGVIGCGFFLLSGLMPLILASIGGGAGGGAAAASTTTTTTSSSSLTALPWLVAAATGVLSGRAADAAIARGLEPLRVRRAFQTASFALCAASVLPLAAPERSAALFGALFGLADFCPRAFAACALTANLVSYSLSFGGFHPYLQDVGSRAAGVLQGLTNSVSIACGCAATLFCGWAGQAHGGYGAAFAALAGLYALGAWAWAWGARGARVRLVGMSQPAA